MAKKNSGSGFSLKDQLFNHERVRYLANQFAAADDRFETAAFVRQTMKRLPSLELKQRIVHIAQTLEDFLSSDFKTAARQIIAALPPPLDPTKQDDDFGDFIFAPLGEFVTRNGVASKHVKTSLQTLKQITQRFSMEDAIRTFIDAHTDVTMAELKKWATDSNYHVRRLVSEGTRPMLPWSRRLTLDAEAAIPLLELLHADSTRYVTRSVSNHLNDIAKTDPVLVLQTLKRWKKLQCQSSDELKWMTRHALRTLVKQGDAGALRLLGYRTKPRIKISAFQVQPLEVRRGDAIEFSFTVTAERSEQLMIDYVVDFVKANGSLAPKVFKLKQLSVAKGESAVVKKRHPLKDNATTFTLFPGRHRITLQINGTHFDSCPFELR